MNEIWSEQEITKGYNYIKLEERLLFLSSAPRLMMLCICTKIHEEISKGFKVIERTQNMTI